MYFGLETLNLYFGGARSRSNNAADEAKNRHNIFQRRSMFCLSVSAVNQLSSRGLQLSHALLDISHYKDFVIKIPCE